MQPAITTAQIDFGLPPDAAQTTYIIDAYTKSNTFIEVFIGGTMVQIYQADNTTNPDQFKVSGDYTDFFPSGISFFVTGSASNDGTYTTVAAATFAGGFTTIYVTNGSITTNEGAGLGTGFVSTGKRLVPANNTATLIAIFCVARDTTTTSAGLGQIMKAAFTKDTTAGSILRIGTTLTDFARESVTGTPDTDLTADVTNGSIKINLKGGSTNLLHWKVVVVTQQVSA